VLALEPASGKVIETVREKTMTDVSKLIPEQHELVENRKMVFPPEVV